MHLHTKRSHTNLSVLRRRAGGFHLLRYGWIWLGALALLWGAGARNRPRNVPVDWDCVDEEAQPLAGVFQTRGSYEYDGAPRQAKNTVAGHFIQASSSASSPALTTAAAWARRAGSLGMIESPMDDSTTDVISASESGRSSSVEQSLRPCCVSNDTPRRRSIRDISVIGRWGDWAAEVGHHGAGVVGSKGSANLSEGALRWKTHDINEAETFKPDAPDDDTYRTVSAEARAKRYWSYASKGASIEHWLKCIAGEETPTTGGEVGRAGIEIAEAAYRSAQTGQVVRLPL